MGTGELAGLLGRRNALRYLGLGILGTVVSACSGNGSGGGPKAQAVRAFVKGTWSYESNQGHEGTLVVRDDGTWETTQWRGISGRWTYEDGVVAVPSLYDSDAPDWQLEPLTVSRVPQEIAPDLRKAFPLVPAWAEVGGDGDLDIQVTGGTVRLTFGGGQRVITCKRAWPSPVVEESQPVP